MSEHKGDCRDIKNGGKRGGGDGTPCWYLCVGFEANSRKGNCEDPVGVQCESERGERQAYSGMCKRTETGITRGLRLLCRTAAPG